MNLRISRYMALAGLVVACHKTRTFPGPVPLDFSCQGKLSQEVLDLTQQPTTKLTLTLTPNSQETKESSLLLTHWSLPQGLQGFLLDEAGNELTSGTPLAWGAHEWQYSPHHAGKHQLTLHLGEDKDEPIKKITLPPIQVRSTREKASVKATSVLPGSGNLKPSPLTVSAWARPLQGDERSIAHKASKEVVALSIRLENKLSVINDQLSEGRVVNDAFKLQRWQLPEGMEGVLENEAGERLKAFPLKAHQTSRSHGRLSAQLPEICALYY